MPPPRKAPTVRDVARVAGVSTATVSRCFNTPDRVIESTRARVMEAVRSLGYAPHFGASMMAARRTMTIGAVIPTMENAIFARGLQAFQEEVGQAGYTLLVASSSYDPLAEEAQLRTLVSRGADGVLLIGHDRDPDLLRFLETQGVPALVAWSYDPGAALPCVGFDNFAAMADMARQVLAFGHRRLALISAQVAGNDRARLRVEGARAAVAQVSGAALQVLETTYGFDPGSAAFARVMAQPQPPTAVLCGNDVLAAGALRAAREMGLEVPRDVSVTGFDDIELARVVSPPLTTAHVPHREMGQKAARALVAMVESGVRAPSQRLAVEIVTRASLGPVAGGGAAQNRVAE